MCKPLQSHATLCEACGTNNCQLGHVAGRPTFWEIAGGALSAEVEIPPGHTVGTWLLVCCQHKETATVSQAAGAQQAPSADACDQSSRSRPEFAQTSGSDVRAQLTGFCGLPGWLPSTCVWTAGAQTPHPRSMCGPGWSSVM